MRTGFDESNDQVVVLKMPFTFKKSLEIFGTYISCYIQYIYIYLIWVNYNISLTWIKATWGWFPLLTMIPGFGRSEVVIKFTQIILSLMVKTWLVEHHGAPRFADFSPRDSRHWLLSPVSFTGASQDVLMRVCKVDFANLELTWDNPLFNMSILCLSCLNTLDNFGWLFGGTPKSKNPPFQGFTIQVCTRSVFVLATHPKRQANHKSSDMSTFFTLRWSQRWRKKMGTSDSKSGKTHTVTGEWTRETHV